VRELETERLRLRFINENDAENIFYGWANDPEVTKYLTWNYHTDVSQTNIILALWLPEYENDNCYRYGIERKSDGVLMGMIDVVGFHSEMNNAPEIGYASGRKYWGNGYMTEACKAVIEELFNDGYETIAISAVADNIGSNEVIKKCGFRFVSSKVKALSEIKPNEICTINYYRLDK